MSVRTIDAVEAPDVVEILTRAFHDDAVSGWVFPDEQARPSLHRAMFGVFVEVGLAAGRVYRAGVEGAAVWLASERVPDDMGERVAAALAAADPTGESAARLGELGALTDGRHPREPHAYLPFIGVVPGRRGRGVGGALLAHHLCVVDDAGLPAYLEASAARARPLYARHGYAPYGEPIRLPGGREMWPMWREPAAS